MQALRKHIRNKRQNLSPLFQAETAQTITQHFLASPVLLANQHVALYYPHQAEVDTRELIAALCQLDIQCYLPYLNPQKKQELLFLKYRPGDLLIQNRLGIEEPVFSQDKLIPALALELVLLPVVAFDVCGHRLGMGGGYYDRTFAGIHTEGSGPRPTLVGLAYGFQEIAYYKPESWDISLDGIITENGYLNFKNG